MTAVERIEAAITKLETLKTDSTEGEWLLRFLPALAHMPVWPVVIVDGVGEVINTTTHTFSNVVDAELIVTLHRTIDAQLAILRMAIDQANNVGFPYEDHDPEVRLANAILGDPTD